MIHSAVKSQVRVGFSCQALGFVLLGFSCHHKEGRVLYKVGMVVMPSVSDWVRVLLVGFQVSKKWKNLAFQHHSQSCLTEPQLSTISKKKSQKVVFPSDSERVPKSGWDHGSPVLLITQEHIKTVFDRFWTSELPEILNENMKDSNWHFWYIFVFYYG